MSALSSPGNRAYHYAKLAISSLMVAITINSTHFAYPWRDGQAELSRADLNSSATTRLSHQLDTASPLDKL